MKGIIYFNTIRGVRTTVAAPNISSIHEVKWSFTYWGNHTKIVMQNGDVIYAKTPYDDFFKIAYRIAEAA